MELAPLPVASSITVRHMNRCLFMTDQNMLNLVVFEKGIINIEHRPTGIPKYVLSLRLPALVRPFPRLITSPC